MRTHGADWNIQTAYQLLGDRSDEKLAQFSPAGSTHDQASYTVLANETLNLVDRVPATNFIGTRQILLAQFQRNLCENGFRSTKFLLFSDERISSGLD